jgi:hypothetical protein
MTWMVQIHGNYCGPNWTAGKALRASDPKVDWSVKAIDKLDQACKEHDLDCSHPGGCSKEGDLKLIAKAQWIALTDRRLRDVAQSIAAAISIASITRRR